MQKNALKTCKKLINLIFFALLCAQLSAYSGFLNGEKDLRVAKTQWFDIIYPQRCEESAAILYENADRVYEEITAEYGLTPSFRMPVVITPSVEQFNAFWTAVPYNHIAMFDTGSSGSSDLSVFTETFLSTFRHELTHAVTYNMKSPFWRSLDKVFGDCVVPGMLTVTTGMAEGATVAMESSTGEGRLNSDFTTHYVKQAKIEDDFPAYHDVSGSADIQPGTAPYYFNGAFHAWLQKKYGLAAYAKFWYRVVNGKNLTISGAFKKAFGVKLKTAWKQFEEEYKVPDIPANPVSAGLAKDFFEPDGSDYSRLNDAGYYFASLTAGGGRLVWLDYMGSRVYETDNTEGEGAGDYRPVFVQQGMTGVRLSEDGRFLAVNYVSSNAASQKVRTKIYDFETKDFFTIKETGLKDSVVVGRGGGRYLVAQKYSAQHYSLAVYRLLFDDDGRRITGLEPFTELKLETEVNPYAFTPVSVTGGEGDATFAWIKKDRLSYSLCISSVDGTLLREFSFPQGMIVQSFSYSPSDSSFYFSYVQKGTMPRLGALRFSDGLERDASLCLTSLDLSGGIFEPVFWNNQIVYIGEFLRMSRLLCLEKLDFEEGPAGSADKTAGLAETSEASVESAPESSISSFSIPSASYNPFPYMIHGILIPLSDYASDSFNNQTTEITDIIEEDGEINTDALFDNFYLGATYITANPWANGSTDLYKITGGFNTVTKTFGTALTVSKGTATSLARSQTTVKSEFNKEGWKQGGLGLDLSCGLELGRISYISLSNSAAALANRQEVFSLSDVATLSYSNARKSGPGRFERSGITASVSYGKWYEASFSTPDQEIYETSALAAGLRFYLPRLLPFESKYGYTYNLPFTGLVRLLPGTSNYGYVSFGEEVKTEKERTTTENSLGQVVFDAEAEITLFSADIQKAVPFLVPFYLSEFFVAGGYSAAGTAGSATKDGFQTANLGEYFPAVVNGTGYYLDSFFAKAQLDFVPNVGLFANAGYKMGVYALYSFTLHSSKDLSLQERIRLTCGFNMNF